MQRTSFNEQVEALVKAMREMGSTAAELTECINKLNQLQPGTPTNTDTPNQKSDLEIFPQIEISEEFLNLKIDN